MNGKTIVIADSMEIMLEEEDGKYIWMGDPKALAERIGSELAMAVIDRSRTFGNHPASVGRDAGT